MEDKEFTISFKINRHFIIGLVVGLVLGSTGTVVAARIIGGSNTRGASGTTRTITTGSAPTEAGAVPSAAAAEISVGENDHVRGNPDARVLLVEYSDFECPFCQRHHPTMQSILQKYGDQVAWVYKHFPLSFHPQAMPAALASECAAEQGKFWEFADAVFERQEDMKTRGAQFFNDLAGQLGLNSDQFKTCFDSQKYQAKVNADMAEGQANGATGTPATFVNGILISGAVPQAQLEQVIDRELAN